MGKNFNAPSPAMIAALRNLQLQRKWIADHGQTLSGYIDQYTTHNYTTGAQIRRIHAADMAALRKAEARIQQLRRSSMMWVVIHFDPEGAVCPDCERGTRGVGCGLHQPKPVRCSRRESRIRRG